MYRVSLAFNMPAGPNVVQKVFELDLVKIGDVIHKKVTTKLISFQS